MHYVVVASIAVCANRVSMVSMDCREFVYVGRDAQAVAYAAARDGEVNVCNWIEL